MLGSIFIGLSGMNAYARGLRTISHNVANLNTPGFKATSVRFTDQFNQGGLGAAYRSGGSGQLGMGVRLGQAALDFAQGDLRQTGQNLDLAVQGQGFLVLLDGGDVRYARTGQFTIDDTGGVSLIGGGGRLAVLDASNRPVALSVNVDRALEPQATTRVRFANNLSSSATEFTVSNIQVYDSLGARHTWSARFTPVGAASPGEWTVTVLDAQGDELHQGQIRFIGGVIDPASAQMEVTTTPAGAAELAVNFDFSGHVTSFSSGTTSTLSATTEDGSALGVLTSVAINAQGRVVLTYSNGRTEDAGAVALAAFRDPQALEQLGDGRFRADVDDVSYVASGDARGGRVVSGQLEASNVDLSQQFGELILIQRGFQASSQVVSVSNDMIQQLFGIRGQG